VLPAAARAFCTFVNPDYDLYPYGYEIPATRRWAVLAHETRGALFYVDADDASGFASADWERLGAWWEVLQASVGRHTGPPSDVDGNGRFILLFSSALGSARSVANAFDLVDAAEPRCGRRASNHADMVHLHPPLGLVDAGGRPLPRGAALAVVEWQMARTYERMVDWAGHGLGEYQRDDELTHGRMELAATVAGSGSHDPTVRGLAAPLLFTRDGAGGFLGYRSMGLYGGSYRREVNRAAFGLFLLYLGDRLGPEFTDRLFSSVVTMRELEEASGLPTSIAYALWAGALLFSNEPASPWRGFDYTGPDWTPLHEKFGPFEYAPLEAGAAVPVALAVGGLEVLVTGVAAPGGGTVTVTTTIPGSSYDRPSVAAIPFEGSLP
jgi:hypothetical protein